MFVELKMLVYESYQGTLQLVTVPIAKIRYIAAYEADEPDELDPEELSNMKSFIRAEGSDHYYSEHTREELAEVIKKVLNDN